MKLPSFKRLLSTDFKKDYKSLIDQLGLSLNNGITVLYDALDRNISLRDNIKSTVRDVVVSVNSNGTPKQTAAFTLDSPGKIDAVLVGLAVNQTNSSIYPLNGPFVTGNQGTTFFTITNITGLTPNDNWLLRIITFHQ